MSENYTTGNSARPELLKTNPRNRGLKKNKIAKYKLQIQNGTFECTHQGIAITEEGKLIDGHHRLTALVETGVTTRLFVVYNAKESTKIDQGAARTDRDSLYMSGMIEKDSIEYNKIVFPLVGFAVRRSLGDGCYRMLSGIEKHRVYLLMQDIIDPIVKIARKHACGNGQSVYVLYPMMVAYKSGVPAEVLDDWHRVLTTYDCVFDDDMEKTKAAGCIRLFRSYLEYHRVPGQMGKDYEDDLIRKAESSIRHFNEKKQISKLMGALVYDDIYLSYSDVFGEVG